MVGVVVMAAPSADRVDSIPGFEEAFENLNFEIYSGFLDVEVTGLQYQKLSIHYEFHTSQRENCSAVAVWHQGGPGGSGIFGAWTEMGPFQMMAGGPVLNLENAWNNAAHMLYLESPAGSTIADKGTGWSSCGEPVCAWDDKTQAVAYVATLDAFFAKFPEFSQHRLFLVGESYAGQYIPNIAMHLLDRLSGIAVGNGCWGGNETTVKCNGPHAEKNDIDMYFGKGLISRQLYAAIQRTCDWSIQTVEDDDDGAISVFGPECVQLLLEAKDAVGRYNIYNIYDNCQLSPTTNTVLTSTATQQQLLLPAQTVEGGGGGYDWQCESDPALDRYFSRPDVLQALHLDGRRGSGFVYRQSGPASILLYPTILRHMRVLIYNGDADLCVPYIGNEEWTTSMVPEHASEKKPWRPWYAEKGKAPSGYVTTYTVHDKLYNETSGDDFAFLTVRLAGHMVPQYQPKPALYFFKKFIDGENV